MRAHTSKYIYNLSNFLYRQAGLCFKKSVTICCDCRSCLHSTLKEINIMLLPRNKATQMHAHDPFLVKIK